MSCFSIDRDTGCVFLESPLETSHHSDYHKSDTRYDQLFWVFLWLYGVRSVSRSVDHWLEVKGKSDALLFLLFLFDVDENGVAAVHYSGGLCDYFDTLSEHAYRRLFGHVADTHEHNIADHDRRIGRPSLGSDNAGIEIGVLRVESAY